MRTLEELTRPNIWQLAPYSSARNEYSGHVAHVFLDANENPYNQPFNRYPDPLQHELKERISKVKGIPAECIFLGNGSDEAIDLPYRCFTRPGIDNVVAIEPTYGMYKVCADINDVEYRPVLLDENYQITADKLLAACDKNTKIIWICSPNNPTGNSINREAILKVINGYHVMLTRARYCKYSACNDHFARIVFHTGENLRNIGLVNPNTTIIFIRVANIVAPQNSCHRPLMVTVTN